MPLQPSAFKPRKSWAKRPQEKKKKILGRFLVWSARKRGERVLPAHSFSHQLNTAQTARWYLKAIGSKAREQNLGELASIGHDLVRLGQGHGLSSAKAMGKLLAKRVGRKPLARMTNAMFRHGIPAVKNGKRIKSDPVSDSVFFADRMETMGAYGAFRLPVSDGEMPRFQQMFEEAIRQRVSQMEMPVLQRKRQEYMEIIRQDAMIDVILLDARECIMYTTRPGFYKDGKEIDAVPMEKYYPKKVLPTIEKYVGELRNFSNALAMRKPWALEIATVFFGHGQTSTKQLNDLILEFKPHTEKAREFRQRALNYIAGKIEEG